MPSFVVVSRDPDLAAANDGVLDLYRFQNGQWSARQVFAAGGVENRLPYVAFDHFGIGNVVWQRGADFVSATLDDPRPRVVRAGSTDLGFYDAQLAPNKDGDLTLVYQQPGEDGAANLFGVYLRSQAKTWNPERELVGATQRFARCLRLL